MSSTTGSGAYSSSCLEEDARELVGVEEPKVPLLSWPEARAEPKKPWASTEPDLAELRGEGEGDLGSALPGVSDGVGPGTGAKFATS